MRCFFVLVHGRLKWCSGPGVIDPPETNRPVGFYCHRYVLATGEDAAKDSAFRRVQQNLDKQTGWMSAGLATLELQADEVVDAPMHKLLWPDNRGHTFYVED